jgi:hypothetical protein
VPSAEPAEGIFSGNIEVPAPKLLAISSFKFRILEGQIAIFIAAAD